MDVTHPVWKPLTSSLVEKHRQSRWIHQDMPTAVHRSSHHNTPHSQPQLPRRAQGPTVTHFSATSQGQEPRNKVAPQYSPPCWEGTGITSTHSPRGRTSHVTPRNVRPGEWSPGWPPSSNSSIPQGEHGPTVVNQLP